MILPLFFVLMSATPGTPPLVDILLLVLGIVAAIIELRKIASTGDLGTRVALVEQGHAFLLKSMDRVEAILFAPGEPEESDEKGP